jgi:hypothetical protein
MRRYGLPMTLSRADLPKVRENLVRALQEVVQTLKTSRSEEAVCLTVDLLRF